MLHGRGPLIAAVLLAAACSDAIAPAPGARPSVSRAMVTGAALAALDESGHFRALLPAETSPYPMLADTQALRVAREFWATYGLTARDGIIRDRGASFDHAAVAVCGGAYFAESPYTSPPDSLSLSARQDVGPHWLVPLCNGAVTQALLSVPAYAARFDLATSRVVPSGLNNTVFDIVGIPDGVTLALSAEEATIAVATLTGVRVAQVPRLLGVERPISPWYANWSVTVDREVTTTGVVSGHRRDVTTYFFGNRPNYGNAAQPRWPLALQADTNIAAHSASFVLFDAVLEPDGSIGFRPIGIQQRPYATFGTVEAVTVP